MKKRLLKKRNKELVQELHRLRHQVLHPFVHIDIHMRDDRGVASFADVGVDAEQMPAYFSEQVRLTLDRAVRTVLEGYENSRCAMYAAINENLQEKLKTFVATSANPIKVEVTTNELREILKNADDKRL